MSIIRTLSPAFDWRADGLEFPVTTEVAAGLAGVIATTTEVVWLDPASGSLAYRGRPVEVLAAESGFEEVAFLLITGIHPHDAPDALAAFRHDLRASRHLPAESIELVRSLDPGTHPTRMLRAGISAVGCHELSADDEISGDAHWRELRIVGQIAALVGEIEHHRAGRPSAPPEPGSSLAEGILGALNGRKPADDDVRLLDLLWVLYAAHGLDAPTFTSIIVASCRADPYFNLVAGLSALRGPRQGGAVEAVLDQLGRIDHPDDAERYVRRTLDESRPIAGFGHRSYRMPDPRVVVLRRELAALARRRGQPEVFAIARALEDAATRVMAPKGIHVNINFYAAPIFALLGADGPLAPCLYAVARTAGIVALVREALDEIRLVRPLDRYVGQPPRHIEPPAPR